MPTQSITVDPAKASSPSNSGVRRDVDLSANHPAIAANISHLSLSIFHVLSRGDGLTRTYCQRSTIHTQEDRGPFLEIFLFYTCSNSQGKGQHRYDYGVEEDILSCQYLVSVSRGDYTNSEDGYDYCCNDEGNGRSQLQQRWGRSISNACSIDKCIKACLG